jgi:hypothetical protein
LTKLRPEEESKWVQRAEVKHVQKGEITQSIFTILQVEKHRKKIPIRTRPGDHNREQKSESIYL